MVAKVAEASGSGSNVQLQSDVPGFHTSLDYIPFDFGEDEEEEGVGASASSSMGPRIEESHGWDAANTSRGSSPGGRGKKRKREDGDKRAKRRELARGTPWCADVDFDQCRTVTDILHEELAAFEQWISPSPKEHETRSMVIQLIRRAITSQWRDASVHSFGSQNTELYMPQGDIDLVVVSASMENQRREGALRNMAACLRRNNLATDVQVIAKAKVPIIKFVCTYGNFRVDISVNQTNGLEAADFVVSWLKKMPSLRPIIMATKLLLSQRGMSEVFSGGLGSFSVICMAISHFQLHPKIQRQEIDPSRNLGVLFLEFLELYGKNFGYDRTGISIRGRGGYFDKQARGWLEPARPYMLAIEDPNDPSNNICRGSFQILQVRSALGGAFDILTSAMCERAHEMTSSKVRGSGQHKRFTDEDDEARAALLNGASNKNEGEKDPASLLGTIIGVNREAFRARKEVADLWDSGSLQFKLRRAPPAPSPEPVARRRPPSPPRESRAERRRREQASLRHEDNPTSSRLNGIATTTNGGLSKSEGSSRNRANGQGTSKDPVVIVDTSSSADSRLERTRRPSTVRQELAINDDASDGSSVEVLDEEELAASQGISFASSQVHHSDVDDDDDEAKDSRYASQNGGRASSKRRKRLEDYAREAPDAYVTDSSVSDDGGHGGSNGTSVQARAHAQGEGQGSKKPLGRRHEFWANKGNPVGKFVGGDDDDYDDGHEALE